MALVIPNIESNPTFDGQSNVDATDLAAMSSATSGSGVVSGCQVSPQSSPNMTVQVAAGTIFINTAPISVSATSSVSIGAASSTDRRDIIVVNSSGVVSAVSGTPCGTAGWTRSSLALPPVKPSIPAGSVLLGEVYVASTTTSITAGNIIDKTAIVNPRYYGSFYSDQTQTAASANTPYVMTLNQTPEARGVSIVSGSRITFANAGTYNVQFSAQVSGTHTATIDIWLRQNGLNVVWSGGEVYVSNQNSYVLPAWNYVMTFASGDYLELVWATSDNSVTLLAQAAQTTPFVMPAVPSVILTAQQV